MYRWLDYQLSCSREFLEDLIKVNLNMSSEYKLRPDFVKAIIDAKQKNGETKSTLYIACEQNFRFAVEYLLDNSNEFDRDLRSFDPKLSESPLSYAEKHNPSLFLFILNKYYKDEKIKTNYGIQQARILKNIIVRLINVFLKHYYALKILGFWIVF